MKLFPAICWNGWQGRTRLKLINLGSLLQWKKSPIIIITLQWLVLTDKICLIQNSTGAFFVWQKELRNDFSTEFDLRQQYYHFHYPAWILYTWTCLCLRRVSYLFERVPNFAAASALMRASSDLNFLSSNMLQSNTAIAQQCIYLPDNSKNLKK